METKAPFLTQGELFVGRNGLKNQREPTNGVAVLNGVDPTQPPIVDLPPLPSALPIQGSLGMTQELSSSFLSESLLSPGPSMKPSKTLEEAKPAADAELVTIPIRKGRWSPEEKILFLHGLRLFGKGRWKKIRHFLPMRSLVQIKSHGQKVIERQEAGEDIYKPLEENKTLLASLVTKALTAGDLTSYSKPRNENRGATDKSKQSRRKKQNKNGSHEEGQGADGKKETGGVAALAAAALWQMSSDQKEV